VAQQDLNFADVVAGLQQMGWRSCAAGVESGAFGQPGFLAGSFETETQRFVGQRVAILLLKEEGNR